MASQLSVKQCQGPECRALRASLEEAVALLRDAADVINLPWHDKRRRFLSSLDGGKVTR